MIESGLDVMKNVLLVANHKRTVSWAKALLSLSDIDLYLVVVIPGEKEAYVNLGVPAGKIFDISSTRKSVSFCDIYERKKYEDNFEHSYNSIISSDRQLRQFEYVDALTYLDNLHCYFSTILIENKINTVFLEPTWAHEILMCEVADLNGVSVYFPHTMRLPYEFFLFFKGCHQKNFYVRKASEVDFSEAQDLYRRVVHKGEKPLYYYKNNKKNTFSFSLVKSFFSNFASEIKGRKNLYITPTTAQQASRAALKILRKLLFKKFVSFSNIGKKKYLFVSLHVQPESSIDVLGNMYNNQVEYIRAISKTTPSSYSIYVKEHSNAIGDRPINFYKEIQKIPGVVLVDPFADSHVIMKGAEMVISVSGTTSFEASLMGVPSVTSAKMFFSELLVKDGFNPYSDKVDKLLEDSVIWKANFSENIMMECYYRIVKNSFEGDTTDYGTNPLVTGKENVEKLAKAFSEVIAYG